MSRVRLQSWVWLLLPFLVARALVPAGFMAQAVQGQLQIVFCTAGYSQPQPVHAAGKSAGHSVSIGQSHDKSQNEFSCPFGQAVATPLLEFSGTELIAYQPRSVIVTESVVPYFAVGPPRVLTVRGPPYV